MLSATHRSLYIFVLFFSGTFLFLFSQAAAQPLDLILPTDNDALLRGEDPDFYMYTHRNFEGQRSRPWQGGQYGYVRNPRRTSQGIVYTRFHGGLDIRPVTRDGRGEPMDDVRTVDDGQVVYVNPHAGRSTYGIYVVVEHQWSGSPIYTLYAHLNEAYVEAGQEVNQGEPLGRIGYTGRGINRQRAHLHFEINLLVNESFQRWFDIHYRSSNHHGIYNGINMRSINASGLYREMLANPSLTIGRFITQEDVFFSVKVPLQERVDLLERYPWLQRRGIEPEHTAWKIDFTQAGVPIGFTPVEHEGRLPAVTLPQEPAVSCNMLTRGFLTSRCQLSQRGQREIELLMLDPT